MDDVQSTVEAIFRREWGRAVAVVTRLTGDLALAEDAVAEAFADAVGAWARGQLPPDPAGWLIAVAKNKALDRMRRQARRYAKEEEAMRLLGCPESPRQPGAIADDQLRLIFTCCHPALDPGTRVALTLRSLCGLTTAQIARSFLVTEATMAQRLVRSRVDGVQRVLYLVFTEGHRASVGPGLVRHELCDEAIRLARLVSGLCPQDPEMLGLLALMLLTDARRAARTAADGGLVLLADQDRSRWDSAKIGRHADS